MAAAEDGGLTSHALLDSFHADLILARIIREITAEEQASSVVANGPVP